LGLEAARCTEVTNHSNLAQQVILCVHLQVHTYAQQLLLVIIDVHIAINPNCYIPQKHSRHMNACTCTCTTVAPTFLTIATLIIKLSHSLTALSLPDPVINEVEAECGPTIHVPVETQEVERGLSERERICSS
jgi:hypothetical protein